MAQPRWSSFDSGPTNACALSLALALVACGHRHEGPPKIGERSDDGGTVVEVTPVAPNPTPSRSGCFSVTTETPAEWDCTEEQLELVSGRPVPGTTVPGVSAPPSADAANPEVELRATDCEGLAELRRPYFEKLYVSQLDAQRRGLLSQRCLPKRTTYLVDGAGNRISHCPNSPPSPGSPTFGSSGGQAASPPAVPAPGTAPSPPDSAAEDPGGGASEYSTTNTQVRDVDEADFVKNDAEHVYVLSPKGLHVIDAWPAEDTREIARVVVGGEPRRMFLQGDILAVYSRVQATGATTHGAGSTPSAMGCTYGYDCRYTSEGGRTRITLFDVSNAASPREIHRYEMSGAFVAARRVEQFVYTVVHDNGAQTAPPLTIALEGATPAELDASYAGIRDGIGAAVDEIPSSYFVPWVEEVGEAGGEPEVVKACDSALVSRAAEGLSFVSVVAFDLETLAPPARTLVAGRPGFVYSSAEALYLASDGVDGADTLPTRHYGAAEGERSTIHKFRLDGTRTEYSGSSAVRGHVLNQFSMDEYDGVLRVATSSGYVPSPDVSSNITTLSETENGFELIGELTGLAPQEDIRAVRFDGDQGFVVTFKKTDPLFVIDLSEPARPAVLGELKIPGFSTYMQRLDEDHLLAVGFDADDQGSFAYFDGIQIQIFDISELSDPKLLHKTVVGTRGSGSEALMNHLAFNFYGPKRLLGLPMTICEGGDNGIYGDELTFSGLMVFDVSLEDGITERGRMPFVDVEKTSTGAQPATGAAATSCGAWWTNSTSLVKRSIFMDNFALGISDTTLNVASLSKLSDVIGSVSLSE